MIKPFLKWAGGKSQLLPVILPLIPEKIDTYYEPFVGGGAVLFALQPKNAIVSDKNWRLINCYEVIQSDPEALIQKIQALGESDKETYKTQKALINSKTAWKVPEVDLAAAFIYLNKTCYNGLYRVNKKGEFNTPFGDYKNPTIVDPESIRDTSRYLSTNNIILRHGDFLLYIERTGIAPNDFVYFDPPYAPSSDTSFANYESGGFDDDNHRRLRAACSALTRKGVKWMQSNSDTPFIRELYKGYRMIEVQARRNINCNGSQRGPVGELLIMNYDETKK